MNYMRWLIVVLFFALSCRQDHDPSGTSSSSQQSARWEYSGIVTWDGLCKAGTHQSPIDIPKVAREVQKNVTVLMESVELLPGSLLENNGHAIQGDFSPPYSNVMVGDSKYELLQFHFHSPSEHTLNGKSYPLEMHFVHKNPEGQILVVGVLFEEGEHNAVLDGVLKSAPDQWGPIKNAGPNLDLHALFPDDHLDYFKYEGSLTTPPCSEGVQWFVSNQLRQMSDEQVTAYRKLMGGQATNRQVQPLNGRVVRHL